MKRSCYLSVIILLLVITIAGCSPVSDVPPAADFSSPEPENRAMPLSPDVNETTIPEPTPDSDASHGPDTFADTSVTVSLPKAPSLPAETEKTDTAPGAAPSETTKTAGIQTTPHSDAAVDTTPADPPAVAGTDAISDRPPDIPVPPAGEHSTEAETSQPAVIPVIPVEGPVTQTASGGSEKVPETEHTEPHPENIPVEIPSSPVASSLTLNRVPAYNGRIAVKIDNNVPEFSDAELITSSFEIYSKLDSLGRCGVCYANIGKDLMPTEARDSIGTVRPSGFQLDKYDFVDGKYLFNRCHLIGYQLSGENANISNLITGTRYMNTEGMLPYENIIANYVKSTGNHVLYRVTPMFSGNNLVADGVHMEAKSVEDKGNGVSFNIFVYNIQPGVIINYADGSNRPEKEPQTETSQLPTRDISPETESGYLYIINVSSGVFHLSSCGGVETMKEENKLGSDAAADDLIARGYVPCGSCLKELAAKRDQISTGHNPEDTYKFVLNTNTMKIHMPTCKSVKTIKNENIAYTSRTLDELHKAGYKDCGNCHPYN